MREINIAHFTCVRCGHRSTTPEAINAIAHQMDTYAVLPATGLPNQVAEQARIATLQAKHKGNAFTIETRSKPHPTIPSQQVPDIKTIRIARSYAKAEHDATELAESNHITLKCPQCDAVLYEVTWRDKR